MSDIKLSEKIKFGHCMLICEIQEDTKEKNTILFLMT